MLPIIQIENNIQTSTFYRENVSIAGLLSPRIDQENQEIQNFSRLFGLDELWTFWYWCIQYIFFTLIEEHCSNLSMCFIGIIICLFWKGYFKLAIYLNAPE